MLTEAAEQFWQLLVAELGQHTRNIAAGIQLQLQTLAGSFGAFNS